MKSKNNDDLVECVAIAMYEQVGPTVHAGKFQTFSRACRVQEWTDCPDSMKKIVRMNARRAIVAVRAFDAKNHG